MQCCMSPNLVHIQAYLHTCRVTVSRCHSTLLMVDSEVVGNVFIPVKYIENPLKHLLPLQHPVVPFCFLLRLFKI